MSKHTKNTENKEAAKKTARRRDLRAFVNALLVGASDEALLHPRYIPLVMALTYLNNFYGGGA